MFVFNLLPKNRAVELIKDIRDNDGSRGNLLNKMYEFFLEEKDPSWKKIYYVLREAECNDLAEIVEASIL